MWRFLKPGRSSYKNRSCGADIGRWGFEAHCVAGDSHRPGGCEREGETDVEGSEKGSSGAEEENAEGETLRRQTKSKREGAEGAERTSPAERKSCCLCNNPAGVSLRHAVPATPHCGADSALVVDQGVWFKFQPVGEEFKAETSSQASVQHPGSDIAGFTLPCSLLYIVRTHKVSLCRALGLPLHLTLSASRCGTWVQATGTSL